MLGSTRTVSPSPAPRSRPSYDSMHTVVCAAVSHRGSQTHGSQVTGQLRARCSSGREQYSPPHPRTAFASILGESAVPRLHLRRYPIKRKARTNC